MKTKLTFALVASLTSTAFAEFKAPLPEFKNEKQLAEWRAENASEAASQGYAAEETAFYTGKPYLASSGGYAFRYRSYNPEVARWTSEDPSGFPDGANGNVYACIPTASVDPTGLFSISVTNSATYNNPSGTHKAMSSDIKEIDGFSSWMTGLSSSFTSVGWTFSNTGSDLTVNITNYTSNASTSSGGLSIYASVAGSTAAAHQYRWVQMLQTSDPISAGSPEEYFDNPDDRSIPFYETDAEIASGARPQGTFDDGPSRGWPSAGHTTEWKASLFLVDYNSATKAVHLLGGFSYGFQLE